MTSSKQVRVVNVLFVELLRETLFFPIWWYTIGFARMVVWCGVSVKGAAEKTGFALWAKNIFVPMYGETSFSGKFISFGVRLFMMFWCGVATIIWSMVILLTFALYLAIFPLSILGILYHGLGMVFV